MESPNNNHLGIVLPAGGARAAYQVGVLKYIAHHYKSFNPTILSGVSAGSINSTFLAQGDPPEKALDRLYELWSQLQFSSVLSTNFESLFKMGMRWTYDMFLSKVTQKLLLRSLLDASPLAATLTQNIHFWKISRALRQGTIRGVAITATNYHNGLTTIFFDSAHPLPGWAREGRVAVRNPIRPRHIMASCSIPILFEPVRVGDYLYGDGSLRFNFPFSPAIRLGAKHLIAVSIRCPNPLNVIGIRPEHIGMGFIAGTVLNSIFLDSIETDYENLLRINRISGGSEQNKLNAILIQPSQDLGYIAKDFLNDVPYHLRQLLKSTANPEELGDLLSYLMFSPGYLKVLLELGFKDAETQKPRLDAFFAAVDHTVSVT